MADNSEINKFCGFKFLIHSHFQPVDMVVRCTFLGVSSLKIFIYEWRRFSKGFSSFLRWRLAVEVLDRDD